MACPNFKKGLKMVFGPLGVKLGLRARRRGPQKNPEIGDYILF
jgi:hypothetical protein